MSYIICLEVLNDLHKQIVEPAFYKDVKICLLTKKRYLRLSTENLSTNRRLTRTTLNPIKTSSETTMCSEKAHGVVMVPFYPR